MTDWYGKTFPKNLWDPEDGSDKVEVPEACEHSTLTLPHEAVHQELLFPRAYAAPEKGDVDMGECDAWERRGAAEGQAKGRGKRKV